MMSRMTEKVFASIFISLVLANSIWSQGQNRLAKQTGQISNQLVGGREHAQARQAKYKELLNSAKQIPGKGNGKIAVKPSISRFTKEGYVTFFLPATI